LILSAIPEEVTAFAFDSPSDVEDADLDLLRDHLQEHGVRPDIDRWPNTGEISATLFGGMTRELLQGSMPVLVSH